MAEEDIITRVLAALPRNLDPADVAEITKDIVRRNADGWTASEIIRMLKCTEEVNPDLDEETALRRMRQITQAVQARKAQRPS